MTLQSSKTLTRAAKCSARIWCTGLRTSILILLILVLQVVAHGQMTPTLTADTYVDSLSPTSNFGTQGSLKVGTITQSNGSVLGHQRTLLKFDLSGVVGLPQQYVLAATLKVYVTKLQPSGISNSVAIRTVPADPAGPNQPFPSFWSEGTVNWQNQPFFPSCGFGGCSGTPTSTNITAANQTVSIDVTQFVREFASGRVDNGFVIYESSSGLVTFASEESGANAPRLEIYLNRISSVTGNNGLTGGGFSGDLVLGVADSGVTTQKLADNSVTSSKIAPDAVGTSQLSPGAVTTSILAPGAVGTTQLSNAAVGTAQLADGSVTSSKITAGAIDSALLANLSVNTNHLKESAVTANKIASGQVVKSLNNLTDNVTLVGGTNVTVTQSGNTLTISSTGGGGPMAAPQYNPNQVALLRWYEARSGISFPVSGNPAEMAFDGANIWTVNTGTNSVTKLSANDGTVLGTYSVGAGPNEILFDGANIWVANIAGSVTKLRASDGALLGTYPTDKPTGLTFDGTFVWVANNNSGTLTKIRASDGTLSLGKGMNGNPYKIVFDGTNYWYTLPFHGAVCRFNLANGDSCLDLGNNTQGLAFDGANVWVAVYGDNLIKKIRVSDRTVVGTYAVGSGPLRVVFDGINIWVTNSASNSVTKLRASDGFRLGDYAAENHPGGIVFDGANVWVSNLNSNTLSKY